MIDLLSAPEAAALAPQLRRLFELSAAKIHSIEASWSDIKDRVENG